MNPTGIDKKVEIDRKENLRKHRLYWICLLYTSDAADEL